MQVNLNIVKGAAFTQILEEVDGNKRVFTDYTGYTFKAQFRAGKSSAAILLATVVPTVVGLGQLKLHLTDAQTALFTGTQAYWDLMALPSGATEPVIMYSGNVTLSESITQWESVSPVTTPSVVGGTYATDQTLELSVNEVGAVIYYTTNGMAPTNKSNVYSAPLVISSSTTVKFFAVDTAGNAEPVKTEIYLIDKVAPVTTAAPAAGPYTGDQTITLTADEAATTYYTTDGSAPTIASTVYTVPFTITAPGIIDVKFFSVDTAGNVESTKVAQYDLA